MMMCTKPASGIEADILLGCGKKWRDKEEWREKKKAMQYESMMETP